MKTFYLLPIIAGISLLAYALRGQSASPETRVRLEAQFSAMGTQANLIAELPAARARIFQSAKTAIETRVKHLENLMSRFRDDSDVSRFNAAAANEWIAVDPLTWRALAEARRVYELSRGAFDITALPLIKLYDYRNAETAVFPDAAALAALRPLIGMDKILWRRDGMKIAKKIDGVQIDLGGVAKGLAVDIAAATFREMGIDNAIVDIGGEQILLGKPLRSSAPVAAHLGETPDEKIPENSDGAWSTGIRDPRRRDEIARVLRIKENCAIATSGDYEKFFIRDGVRYSHIVDPRSGLPVAGGIISATIILPDNCALADALATAVSVLGATEISPDNTGDAAAKNFAPEKSAAFTARELLEIFPQAEAWLTLDNGSVIHLPRRFESR